MKRFQNLKGYSNVRIILFLVFVASMMLFISSVTEGDFLGIGGDPIETDETNVGTSIYHTGGDTHFVSENDEEIEFQIAFPEDGSAYEVGSTFFYAGVVDEHDEEMEAELVVERPPDRSTEVVAQETIEVGDVGVLESEGIEENEVGEYEITMNVETETQSLSKSNSFQVLDDGAFSGLIRFISGIISTITNFFTGILDGITSIGNIISNVLDVWTDLSVDHPVISNFILYVVTPIILTMGGVVVANYVRGNEQ